MSGAPFGDPRPRDAAPPPVASRAGMTPSAAPAGGLDTAARARFAADGFLAPLDAITPAAAAAYRRRLEARLEPDGHAGARLRNSPHLVLAWASDLAHHPRILDAVESLLGPDLLLWRSTLFVKPPGDDGDVAWHQDTIYWDIVGGGVVTAWVALTDSDAGNGAVQVAAATHDAGIFPHALAADQHNRLVRGRVAAPPAAARVESLTLRAGQFSLHHGWLLHASPANRSTRMRAGLALRYITPDLRQRGLRVSARLVRGVDRFGHYDLEPRPRRDDDPVALAWHRRAMRRYGVQVVRQLLRRPSRESLRLIVRLAARREVLRALWSR